MEHLAAEQTPSSSSSGVGLLGPGFCRLNQRSGWRGQRESPVSRPGAAAKSLTRPKLRGQKAQLGVLQLGQTGMPLPSSISPFAKPSLGLHWDVELIDHRWL